MGWKTKILSPKRMRRELRDAQRLGTLEPLDGLPERPRTRADCCNGPRPCPFVTCRYNLFLDVTPAGSVQLNHPGKELEELSETCALDVADRGGITLEQTGQFLNVTRERVRQLEAQAMAKLNPKVAA